MAAFTAYEQLLLELMNRARLDPATEAARLGIGLNDGLAAGTITATPKQPLAGNNLLVTAARGHSQYMINTDQFDHQGIGNGTPTSRMQAAGYTFTGSWSNGENIAWSGTTGTPNVLSYVYALNDNLFRSAHHRENVLEGFFREAGTGVVSGPFTTGGTTFNSVMATENFATSGSKYFVTGVAINDTNSNKFYDVGEARANVRVSVTTSGVAAGSDTTEAAGGYAVGVAAGTHSVTFSGGGLAASVAVTVAAGAANAKVDLAGTNKILSSATTYLSTGAADLALLGAASISGVGNGAANTIEGNRANNSLWGFAGNDRLIGGAGNDVLTGGTGRDVMTGGLGADRFDFNLTSETTKVSSTRDVITDFTHNATLSLSDRIDLSTIDANGAAAGDAFRFIGAASFSGVAGQLRYRQENPAGTANDKTIVEGDIDGNRTVDFQIELTGLKALVTADFFL
jgi:Ca2+-binding RTX toxin-like protein